jgi:hypothetical protein
MSEWKCLCLGELILFQLIKNKMAFLPLQQIYEGRFTEKYPKYRYLSFRTAAHCAGTKTHYISHTITIAFLCTVASKTTVTSSFDCGFRFRMAVRSYRPNLERLFPTSRPVYLWVQEVPYFCRTWYLWKPWRALAESVFQRELYTLRVQVRIVVCDNVNCNELFCRIHKLFVQTPVYRMWVLLFLFIYDQI